MGYVNTHITIRPFRSEFEVHEHKIERKHVGKKFFGPMTEAQVLKKEYDTLFEERSLIGAFNLRDETDFDYSDWKHKYELLGKKIKVIHDRLIKLGQKFSSDDEYEDEDDEDYIENVPGWDN